jgi:hypothetical protein
MRVILFAVLICVGATACERSPSAYVRVESSKCYRESMRAILHTDGLIECRPFIEEK